MGLLAALRARALFKLRMRVVIDAEDLTLVELSILLDCALASASGLELVRSCKQVCPRAGKHVFRHPRHRNRLRVVRRMAMRCTKTSDTCSTPRERFEGSLGTLP
jgi:hypothetical protein